MESTHGLDYWVGNNAKFEVLHETSLLGRRSKGGKGGEE